MDDRRSRRRRAFVNGWQATLAAKLPTRGLPVDTETPRLILRGPRIADLQALFEFLGDAAAMQHTHADTYLRECRRSGRPN